MADSSLSAFLEALQALSSKPAQTRADDYNALLVELLSQPQSSLSAQALVKACSDYLDITAFSDVNASGGGLVVGRNTLKAFDEAIMSKGKASDAAVDTSAMESQEGGDPSRPAIQDEEVQKEILENALEKLQPRALSFEEQATAIRLHLADIHESLQDWSSAASVLQGVPLDSGHRSVSDMVKLQTYIRIVRLLLEADDAIGADAYLKRASMVVHHVPGTSIGGMQQSETQAAAASTTTPEDFKQGRLLGLQYKLSQAKIYDSQRRFAEAAVRYHELSYVAEIDEEERTMMLSAAVTASILAPAGPQRSRILSTLVRDDRTSSLPQATILSKVFLDQIIRPNEVAAFEALLAPHQKAILGSTGNEKEILRIEEEERAAAIAKDPTLASSMSSALKSVPTTVLDRSMIEHNILASSKLYLSVTLAGLGALLGMTPTGTETIVRKMIAQGRLKGHLDQVEGVLTFLQSSKEGPIAGGLGAGTGVSGDGGEGATKGDDAGAAAEGSEDSTPIGQGDGLIRRWDAQIARTANGMEEIAVRIASLPGYQAAKTGGEAVVPSAGDDQEMASNGNGVKAA